MAEPKTLFVTGGTGLVGSHVIEEALARGHRVRALVRASSDTTLLESWGVELVHGDFADPDALRRGVAGVDWVFNCAAKVGDWGQLDDFRTLNVDALRHLLDAAADARVGRFVHVSSLGVYEARDHQGTDEQVPPAIASLDAYTRSKTEAEYLALAYVGRPGLPSAEVLAALPYVRDRLAESTVAGKQPLAVAVVRPGFIYGERDRTVLPKLLKTLRSRVFRYFGTGETLLNCIYVKNLVHGLFLAAEADGAVGEVFNLTDGEAVTKKQFIGRVAELDGLPAPRRHIPRWLAKVAATLLERRARRLQATEPPLVNKARYKFNALNLDYSIAKARRVLGYHPPFTTEQGLTAAMADLAARPSPAAATA